MLDQYGPYELIDELGNLNHRGIWLLKWQYKAQLFGELFGHLLAQKIPVSKDELLTLDGNARSEMEFANNLLFSGDPDTMPTLTKQVAEIKLDVRNELLQRAKSAVKALE